jgi:hypothetical protein
MKQLPLFLASALVLSPLTAPAELQEKQIQGTWNAVKITLSKNATKDQAMQESGLGWYSLDLRPDHTCTVQYVGPLEGRWSLKGSKVVVKPKTIANASMTFKSEPMVFLVSKDGKTLSRTFENRTITFSKK